MDAEILFFMSPLDESEFLQKATKFCDSIQEQSKSNIILLQVANCHLLFTPSFKLEDTLYSGKLEIRLSKLIEEFDPVDIDRAKITFRKLRNWIKKYYWSRLAYNNRNKKNKLTPSRNHWLGPDAKKWKEIDQDQHRLKLSQTSWMEFELGY